MASIIWLGPSKVWAKTTSVGALSVEALGAFGSSFGVVTTIFSGTAVFLLFLTYRAQREELDHLRKHLGGENRRQRAEYLVERLERQLQAVESGNLTGHQLLKWMNTEIDSVFAVEVVNSRPASERWAAVLDESSGLPDVEPLKPIVLTLLGLARVRSEMSDQRELLSLTDLLSSVVLHDDLIPLLFAAGSCLRGRKADLELLGSMLDTVSIRSVISNAFPLAEVPGEIPATIDDILVSPTLPQ